MTALVLVQSFLYDYGYNVGKNDYRRHKAPPGFEPPSIEGNPLLEKRKR